MVIWRLFGDYLVVIEAEVCYMRLEKEKKVKAEYSLWSGGKEEEDVEESVTKIVPRRVLNAPSAVGSRAPEEQAVFIAAQSL